MLTRILFESLWLLGGVLVACQVLLIAWWSWTRSDVARRLVWSGFAAMPVLMTVSTLAVTPGEGIVALCRELAEAVEVGDVATLARHLGEEIEVEGHGRVDLLARLEERLRTLRVTRVRLGGFDVSLSSDSRATVEFRASANVRADDLPVEWMVSRWRLGLRREEDRWLVTSIRRLATTGLDLGDLGGLLR